MHMIGHEDKFVDLISLPESVLPEYIEQQVTEASRSQNWLPLPGCE